MSFLRDMRRLAGMAASAVLFWGAGAVAAPMNIENFVLNLEAINAPGWLGTAEFAGASQVDPTLTGTQTIDLELVSLSLTSVAQVEISPGEFQNVVLTLDPTPAPASLTFNIEFFSTTTGSLSIDTFFDFLVVVDYPDTGPPAQSTSDVDIDITLFFSPQDFGFQIPPINPDPLDLDFTDNGPLVVELAGAFPALDTGGTVDMPEPGTVVLFGAALLGMAGLRRRLRPTTG